MSRNCESHSFLSSAQSVIATKSSAPPSTAQSDIVTMLTSG
ncbi:hypothetical protein DSM3645_02993 [Blastopirellula marina DSM 3645]|uniref:Uncharacterized protein n=1 Tax=Blastopirellula marina DSM 3645 TaxID=314230 RepID=A3ZVR2_9BACT|nr:hypothetical protein DSM3645_02993 [Blastopirellula marina DSM 3645]